jgi:hypothetical protein
MHNRPRPDTKQPKPVPPPPPKPHKVAAPGASISNEVASFSLSKPSGETFVDGQYSTPMSDSLEVPSYTEQNQETTSSFRSTPTDGRHLVFSLIGVIILAGIVLFLLLIK